MTRLKGEKSKRRQKIMKFLAISSIITSLVLSSIALHISTDLDELKSVMMVRLRCRESVTCMALMAVKMEDLVCK